VSACVFTNTFEVEKEAKFVINMFVCIFLWLFSAFWVCYLLVYSCSLLFV
jgi:hypothetical protein